ncbi:MAG: preprotein translocase subunit SecY [Opitutales bacterium]
MSWFNPFLNCFRVPELRQRILFTLGMIFVARVGANIPLPGLNPAPLADYLAQQQSQGGGLVGLYNMFTGGALLKGAIFALGIMPYITASIILQILGIAIPALARLQKEGDIGRQKLTQYTRYLTIGIALIQSLLLVISLVRSPGTIMLGYDPSVWGDLVIINQMWFSITSVIFLTAGTVMLMWIGEQITQRGVGNGISLLITIGILSDLPGAFATAAALFTAPDDATGAVMSPLEGILLVALFVGVTAAVVLLTQGTRRIPVQHAKRVVGRRMLAGGTSSYLPLKVNYSGVMPVIFANALLMVPTQFFGSLSTLPYLGFLDDVAAQLTPESLTYFIIYGVLIMGFAYFWVSLVFKPQEISEQLQQSGGYVPGVRPGEPTAKFLDFVMTRLTLAGAIFLTLIAIFPYLLYNWFRIPFNVAQFFGGTGTLIAVGVMLDTMRQVESYLLQQQYDGFLQKSKKASRSQQRARQLQEPRELRGEQFGGLWVWCGVLFGTGLIVWIVRQFLDL